MFGRRGVDAKLGGAAIPGWAIVALVFMPFAAGYFLSYLFRTINGVVSERLASELGLNAADLGLVTAVYFLVLAAAQIPVGVMLDRYGPRRVQSTLLLVAALGAAAFARSTGPLSLLMSRAVIGLGVAAALTAGLKAIVLWFPRERVALVNGHMVMLGALGAVAATLPAEAVLGKTGWRDLFDILAVTTAGTAILIFFLVPERSPEGPSATATGGLRDILTDRRFWKIAPLSGACIGSAWSMQGLWAPAWLKDVEGMTRSEVVTALCATAVVLSLGAWLLGMVASWTRRKGIRPETLLACVAVLFILAQLMLVFRLPLPSIGPWMMIAIVGSATVLSFAIIADYFPKEMAGRANGVLNVVHFGWGFLAQYGTGLLLAQWAQHDGHYPVIAYQVVFGVNVALQLLALIWSAFGKPHQAEIASSLSGRGMRQEQRTTCTAEPVVEIAFHHVRHDW
ncbi:MFS transporter [Bradyrhizobium sp. SSBR45G]|uniref:MFS transporter n=1 Tax=unclassified Bradyrhizobium TaxID=2631580 RepID=UPI002342A067|nr:MULTISPECIES: MFS transporter [unclassified Bradyrhizobium]GLH77082.1 MFS transporter [Bradyrhizobium sp. SSBR45G]GLH83840.1 MFS transporter [Bradyrhizobium sp. SSBR45R]